MSPASRYRIPAARQRTETVVMNSRFITTIDRASRVDDARAILAEIRQEMPDASHHVYAYRVGYDNSVVEGMSDDGEPSGTAGPPVMAVLRGAPVGDIIVIVTRYFGGTKLGTGGLVRAYGDAARDGLRQLVTEEKIEKRLLGVEIPYSLYELVKRLIARCNGSIQDETFEAAITLLILFPIDSVEEFVTQLRQLSNGQLTPVDLTD